MQCFAFGLLGRASAIHPRSNHSFVQRGSYDDAVEPKDGFGSDTDEIEFECHILPHFNSDMNANVDLIGSGYKTDSLNPDIFSI